MKNLIILFIGLLVVGCGKKTTPAEREAKVEKAAAIKKSAGEAQANAFVNTLGMKFVPVPGTKVQFCIWETRVKGYAGYTAANAGVDAEQKTLGA